MGTIPTFPTFTAGVAPSAATLNLMRDTVNFWALTPRCSVYLSTVQNINNNTSTPIAFDAELFDIVQAGDTESHNVTTNNSRVVIRTAGKYEVTGQA